MKCWDADVELLEFWIFGVLWYGGQVLFGWFSFSLWFCHVPSVLSFLQCWATQNDSSLSHVLIKTATKLLSLQQGIQGTGIQLIMKLLQPWNWILTCYSELIIIQSSMVNSPWQCKQQNWLTIFSHSLWPGWQLPFPTHQTNVIATSWCYSWQSMASIQRSAGIWLCKLPFCRTAVIRIKGQSCFGSVDGCCAEGWWWWRATMVFCRENVCHYWCNSGG